MTHRSLRGRGGWRTAVDFALVAVVLVAVVRFYWWTDRSSGGFNTPGPEDYYNFLVRGWRQGHLYMDKEPSAEMRALADPYDPAQNHAARLGDASYFEGRYYLYFSAAPALVLHWPFYAITGRELGTTTAIFVYVLTGFFAASALWLAVRRTYFPDSAAWTGAAGVLMLALGTEVLVLLRRPLVWELPISSAFAFAMLALLAIFWALHGRRPVMAMGLAGLSFGLAIASRPGHLFGTMMFLPVLWHLWKKHTAARWRWSVVAAAAGIGVCLAAVFWHNAARFGDPLEFGVNYQLTSIYESKARHFSLSYIAHNAGIYFFHPAQWSREFPLIAASAVRGGPPGYLGGWVEGIAGLAVTFPFVWLALAAPLAGNRGPEERAGLRAMIATIALLFAGVVAFFLCFYCATPRYKVEFAPTLVLLAGIGWLGLERAVQSRGWKIVLATGVIVACGVTATAGVLLSFDYHNQLLRGMAPDFWRAMEQVSHRWLGPGGGPN